MAVNVIAKVESSGIWDAINYGDPITVGLMQWFGSRAAKLLIRIRDQGTGWNATGALAALDAQLTQYGETSWWNERWLTGSEGSALKPILTANKAVQTATISDDIDDYRAAAVRLGMNPDTNTNAVIFYCIMYHQTPARANRIVNSAGVSSSIDRLYAVCMNDPVFSRYRTRYSQAVAIIKSGVAPDMVSIGDTPLTDGDQHEDSTDDALNRLKGDIQHLAMVGSILHIKLRNGGTIRAFPDGKSRFLLPAHVAGVGADVPEGGGADIPEDPDAPGPNAPSSIKRQAVIDWGMARLGKYAYTNGPARTDPERTLATDCSGFVKAAYGYMTGIKLGQITSQQYTQGRRISSSKNVDFALLRPGDLIYFKWANPAWQSPKATDHVEMYTGNGNTIGHPGPGKGPRTSTLQPQINNALRIWVQRHIED